MMTIDPRTLSVGPGSGGRGIAFILAAMVIALCAGHYGKSLLAGDADDDFTCVEDVRGVCDPLVLPLDDEDEEDSAVFDDEWANAPTEDDGEDEDVVGCPLEKPIEVELVHIDPVRPATR